MALFTTLGPDDAAAVAGAFALGAVTAAIPLWAGTVNSNFRFETVGAGTVFVRVNEGKDEDEVAYEAQLVAHLAARGVPTPRPLVAVDGRPWARVNGRLVTVFPWVAGAHRPRGALTPADAAALGGALAALHRAGDGFPVRRASRYAFPRLVERWRGLVAPGGAGKARAAHDGELAAALADARDEIAWLEERAPLRSALPAAVIHGDLFPDNVLFEGDRLVALLDFEQASDGVLAYDLAVAIASWCWDDDWAPARARALVAGYERVRPLGAGEREGLPVELRAASLRFMLTRLTDVELHPQASEMTRRTKDYRRFHARLRRLRALGAAGTATLLVGGR